MIPPAVQRELALVPQPHARRAITEAMAAGWIAIVAPAPSPLAEVLTRELHTGEVEAITLSMERAADTLLMDEADGRHIAAQLGLRPAGVAGMFLRAKSEGKIASVGTVMARLKIEARFFISAAFERELLVSAGE